MPTQAISYMNNYRQRLPASFYQSTDVVQLSKALLGKYLVTSFEGVQTAGKIVETEAYRMEGDKACHAYNGRRTARTEVMFRTGGTAYVYLIYGIHHLFNVVTAPADVAHAVLIRGIEPTDNVATMLTRRNFTTLKHTLTAGPGTLSQALGINRKHTGYSLTDADAQIWLEDRGEEVTAAQIVASPRVGVAYAEECAAWNWRFRIRNNPFTSRAK